MSRPVVVKRSAGSAAVGSDEDAFQAALTDDVDPTTQDFINAAEMQEHRFH